MENTWLEPLCKLLLILFAISKLHYIFSWRRKNPRTPVCGSCDEKTRAETDTGLLKIRSKRPAPHPVLWRDVKLYVLLVCNVTYNVIWLMYKPGNKQRVVITIFFTNLKSYNIHGRTHDFLWSVKLITFHDVHLYDSSSTKMSFVTGYVLLRDCLCWNSDLLSETHVDA